MKKIELHLHLEGAAPPDFIRALAAEKRVDLPTIFDARGQYAYADFNDFLRVYEAATSILQGPRNYARLLAEVLERKSRIYDENRPQAVARRRKTGHRSNRGRTWWCSSVCHV